MELEKKIIKTILKNNLIQNGEKVIVAVSGGPDSMALLNSLINIKNCNYKENTDIKFEIVVAHVNHNLREEAQEESEYVHNYCRNNNIPFYLKSIDITSIAKKNKKGIEETARNERYKFFDEVLQATNSNKIAIAHNKNDNVETVLMNMFRGTSINGLKGIEIKRDKYIRPLMKCSREEIEGYCTDNKLNPRIDKSNFENKYTRNKIRNVLIPMIKEEFNPNILEGITRLSELVKEQEEYINNQTTEIYNKIVLTEYNKDDEKVTKEKNIEKYIIIDLKLFNIQENVIKSKVIIYIIINLFGTSKGIEKVHIDDIINLCNKSEGNKFLTPNKKLKVLIKNKKIYFIKII